MRLFDLQNIIQQGVSHNLKALARYIPFLLLLDFWGIDGGKSFSVFQNISPDDTICKHALLLVQCSYRTCCFGLSTRLISNLLKLNESIYKCLPQVYFIDM